MKGEREEMAKRTERYEEREIEIRNKNERTHIVPVGLGELDGRGSPLDACAVD